MTRLILLKIAAVLTGPLWFSACSDEPSVKQYRVQKASTQPAPAANTASAPSGLPFHWTTPAGWREGKASSMRLASYNVPLDGETGDFSLVRLGGGAGGILANINRWRGQIGLGQVSSDQVSNFAHMHSTAHGQEYLHITLVNEENPANAIIAAIFQRSDYVLFTKLTASRAGVEKAQESFEAFCDSLTFAGE